MAVREILQLGNPVLWETSLAVDNINSVETKSVIEDLRDTLASFRENNGFGRGIAAPQIGVISRIIYIEMPTGEFSGPLINPEIVNTGDKQVELWDACFSLPNLMVNVSRAEQVDVEYTNLEGKQRIVKADGDLSELMQHEIDHLDGLLTVHRAISPRAFMTRDEWIRQGRPE